VTTPPLEVPSGRDDGALLIVAERAEIRGTIAVNGTAGACDVPAGRSGDMLFVIDVLRGEPGVGPNWASAASTPSAAAAQTDEMKACARPRRSTSDIAAGGAQAVGPSNLRG
jgi:hypothetical protein